MRKDNLLDENAPELIETAEERAEKMDATVDHLTTRLARLLAEHANANRKLQVSMFVSIVTQRCSDSKSSVGEAPFKISETHCYVI